MSFDGHKNFGYSTVATAPSPASSGTSLVVATADGAKFPAVPFNATVWPVNTQPTSSNAEVVRVTNISTDTFTITRAQESSSARSIGVGDQIAATITAKTLTDVENAMVQVTGGGLETVSTVASSGTSQTLNLANGNVFDVTLTGNCTFTFSGATNGKMCSMTLILRQDATGSRTVTWPGSVTWLGTGIAPTLQTAASSVDSVVMYSVDGGTTWLGVAQTSASGIRSGTSFPGSPSGGDLFYRTDRRIMYEYNSTATLWLSLDRKYWSFALGDQLDSTTGTSTPRRLPLFEDVWVDSWNTCTYAAATNNSSNYWTLSFGKFDSAGGGSTVSSFSTNLDTNDVWVNHNISVGASILSASYNHLAVTLAKTGTPGLLRLPSTLVVRSIG